VTWERKSACKVNFVLNILGRRADGFHELETLFFPVPLHDQLSAMRIGSGIELSCSNPQLACDASNLVWRAARAFLDTSGITEGIRLHLTKNLPLAAGIGAGSANAATTLLLLNELFGLPLSPAALGQLAASLGSDVNFFLQPGPATATGRGERIKPLPAFGLLRGCALLLFRPGFGVATPWAFQHLAQFPDQLNGRASRVKSAVEAFSGTDLLMAAGHLYNSLETPVFSKYPILGVYQEALRAAGAVGTLMSGSGSTTFAMFPELRQAESASEQFRRQFGPEGWMAVVGL
jgi:4-diphosphocytidyl-2-C-methyl-D-erythritol kinase